MGIYPILPGHNTRRPDMSIACIVLVEGGVWGIRV